MITTYPPECARNQGKNCCCPLDSEPQPIDRQRLAQVQAWAARMADALDEHAEFIRASTARAVDEVTLYKHGADSVGRLVAYGIEAACRQIENQAADYAPHVTCGQPQQWCTCPALATA